MVLGLHLLLALLAGVVFWLVALVCERLNAPTWLAAILSFAAGIYVFWYLTSAGVVTIGR